MFFSKLDDQISTEIFTYFIPAPPHRTTGYREKEFDTLCKTLLTYDLSIEILSNTAHQNGMWVMAKVSGKKRQLTLAFSQPGLRDMAITDSNDIESDCEFIIERE